MKIAKMITMLISIVMILKSHALEFLENWQ